MAKTTTKEISTRTLTATACKAISAAYCDALDSVESTGNMVTQVCDAARGYLKGEQIGKADSDVIISQVAAARGWKGASVKARTSEVRIVLDTYSVLPEAVKAFAKRSESCTWHHMLALARRVRKHGKVALAVTEVIDAGIGNGGGKSNPAGRVAGALKAWYGSVRGDKRAAILKAVAILQGAGLKLELE